MAASGSLWRRQRLLLLLPVPPPPPPPPLLLLLLLCLADTAELRAVHRRAMLSEHGDCMPLHEAMQARQRWRCERAANGDSSAAGGDARVAEVGMTVGDEATIMVHSTPML